MSNLDTPERSYRSSVQRVSLMDEEKGLGLEKAAELEVVTLCAVERTEVCIEDLKAWKWFDSLRKHWLNISSYVVSLFDSTPRSVMN